MKLKLDTLKMEGDFFAGSALLGVVSPVPGYRFCWLMNQHFNVNFLREPELDIPTPPTDDKEERFFPIYQFCPPLSGERHLIYCLRSGSDLLLPELKQLDYLWLIQSGDSEEDALTISQRMRDIADVQLAQVLVPEKLKSLNNLMV